MVNSYLINRKIYMSRSAVARTWLQGGSQSLSAWPMPLYPAVCQHRRQRGGSYTLTGYRHTYNSLPPPRSTARSFSPESSEYMMQCLYYQLSCWEFSPSPSLIYPKSEGRPSVLILLTLMVGCWVVLFQPMGPSHFTWCDLDTWGGRCTHMLVWGP